ncbi:thiol reductant ABC exporter, CydD subunit [Enterococcus sp. 7E2_DIV0204]|uniref:Thiol reductant ABC exporter, CydD subunit n=1 Tax=Candidatus Enterococcus lemimoniae TaxID=1834167 RepID=A0ABZ2T9C9_9ENTE|nr:MULTISPECIES: thiol reductant ABC exporter subunit CydD [unclassified Enterococcus]OTN87918.1 thiol reductant ABC exporter, CydD subunit [Enterococcus sp. 7E2_DIV0204]OTO70089.1 thiol reductant ABC exporter, CydD subunit [Enterococcus sp. 12C11_DIV0727]OTP49405.1 thiol reductant ABC exporter, CydD subunit [Enterococcus sp. 7D2_DIV0200]
MIDKAILKMPKIKNIMILLAGFSFLQAVFIIGQAFYLSKAVVGLWEGGQLSDQLLNILVFFLFYTGRHVVTYLREKMLDTFSYDRSRELREALLQKVFRLGPTVVQKNGTGNMITMGLEGISQAENYLHLILMKIMNMMIIPWIILIFVFTLDVRSGVVLLVVFPMIIIFMIILGYAAQSKADKQYKAFQILSNHFIDSLRGLDTLKLFGLSKKYAGSIYNTSERFREATMSTLKIAILSTFALDFFTTLSVAVVAVFLGLSLLEGGILLFPALTTLILAPEFFLPVRDFASDYHATLDGKNSFQAIQAVLDLPEMTETDRLSLSDWTALSELAVEQLTFQYEEATQPALKGLDFAAKGYQKIGIIGASGSGKSTLINVLSGFLEPDAEITTIEVDGQKLPHFLQKEWQKQVLYIPQSPYIFQDTLANNVRFYTPEATDEDVLAAVQLVGLENLVTELIEGLNTVIGESGRMLSGGQAQRVALARAFLDQTRRVLLFDEPTAHLDIETEVELKTKMLPLMNDHLVFFATHRLHWMAEMDYILVMDKGQIVEAGTLAELTEKNGYYVKLVNQMRGTE